MKKPDNKARRNILLFLLFLIVIIVVFLIGRGNRSDFPLPQGKTVSLEETSDKEIGTEYATSDESSTSESYNESSTGNMSEQETNADVPGTTTRGPSDREVFVTDGTKHSIPLEEILSGGPGKDGIPSIDDPKFLSSSRVDFLTDDSVGLGLVVNGDARFYPYSILVWHEIVNDTVGDTPALVTYCPLCATGVVFDPRVEEVTYEFGVSGRLWQSNLLMYNRTGNEDTETLWSQVLGEGVVGPRTGTRLDIIPSDTITYGDWKARWPDTKVLSQETGARRDYTRDPYGDYYTSERIIFDTNFTDERLHPKTFVIGVEIGGVEKAYNPDDLSTGTTSDTVGGVALTLEKSADGSVVVRNAQGEEVPQLRGFWFSWLAAHPMTLLYAES